MSQTKHHSAFSGCPNDWLSPTDDVLDTYGVGKRGDSHPIPLFISHALVTQYGIGASARICWFDYKCPVGKSQYEIFLCKRLKNSGPVL
jgi:hypothetical protein